MKYISLPAVEMKHRYDVVVIGSGYGGGIAASRLSRAGKKVCVMERGKEFQPGEYPDTLVEASEEMQIHSKNGHVGPQTGLYDLHVNKGISVLVGCGLGGTSLINANVSIKPEARVFDDPRWPLELRNEFKDSNSHLSKGYDLAMDMLKSKPLPDSIQLNKLKGLQTSAEYNNEKFYRTNINVNFDVDGLNHVGVEQKPCNLCGDCCSGCNHSAKNTVLVNYLPDAKAHGAELFTQASVSHVEKKGDKWLVYYSIVDSGSDKFGAPDLFVEAEIVVLSAGTLGSNEILLRSKSKGLQVSDQVGVGFSGNGDVLGFAYNSKHVIDGVGEGVHNLDQDKKPGPCITGIIDVREQEELNDGMIIEDAAVPGAIGSLLPMTLDVNSKTIGSNQRQDDDKSVIEKVKQRARAMESNIGGPYVGAMRHTQTYLLMTHDGEGGRIELDKDRLNIDWGGVGSQEIFKKADAQLRKEAKGLSAEYVKNPVWVKAMGNELVSVHPLGGCNMGDSIETAVVNHKGQVFSKDSESGVFENFYITDGSVIPRSLGVNPLITISAVSERCCAIIAEDRNWKIDYASTKKLKASEQTSKKVGVQFTETMKGYFRTGVSNDDYKSGFNEGKTNKESLEFTLTIRSEDVYEMIKHSEHQAAMTGTVTAPSLSSSPLNVSEGIFNLFVDDPNSVNTKLMKYNMRMTSREGKEYYFKGFKYVHDDAGLDQWPDTSTLYITIIEGKDPNGSIIGQGILNIKLADFSKQMKTMKAVNASSTQEGLKAIAAFGEYFSKSLFEVYGGVAAPKTYFNPDATPRKKRELRLCDPEYYPVKTDDGLEILLTRYKGGNTTPLLMVHPFNSCRTMFTIDTIDTNLAEYFFQHGFDVWLLDYRLSCLLPSSEQQHTIDSIASFDYPAAIKKIQEVSEKPEIDVLAHCVGSISLFMALLDGFKGVRSVVSTQIAADFYARPQVQLKANLRVPSILDGFGIETLNAYADTDESWTNKLYDKFVNQYATHLAGACTDPVCQRMTFMFGPLYEHVNLNDATHKANAEMLGKANMQSFEQLTKMLRTRKLVTADGKDSYMNHFERLNIPITFIHGEENKVFNPKSTLTTYNKLCEINGKELYTRHVIPGYGHNDCLYGKDAVNIVYPLMLKHFERFNEAIKSSTDSELGTTSN
ncbi:MAG: GMC family oxidoreductase N-terminal domain-containing protein [Bacteroidia bacterium]